MATGLARLSLAGGLAGMAMAGLSFVVNDVLLGAEHAQHTFFRPYDHVLIVPGLPMTSLVWGILLAVAYQIFGASIRIAHPVMRGAVFGLAVYALLVVVHELFYFQFIQMSPLLLIGGLAHYALSYTVAGVLIGAILGARIRAPQLAVS